MPIALGPVVVVDKASQLFEPTGMLDIITIKTWLRVPASALLWRCRPTFLGYGGSPLASTSHLGTPCMLQHLLGGGFTLLPNFCILLGGVSCLKGHRLGNIWNLAPWGFLRCGPQVPHKVLRVHLEVGLHDNVIWESVGMDCHPLEGRYKFW